MLELTHEMNGNKLLFVFANKRYSNNSKNDMNALRRDMLNTDDYTGKQINEMIQSILDEVESTKTAFSSDPVSLLECYNEIFNYFDYAGRDKYKILIQPGENQINIPWDPILSDRPVRSPALAKDEMERTLSLYYSTLKFSKPTFTEKQLIDNLDTMIITNEVRKNAALREELKFDPSIKTDYLRELFKIYKVSEIDIVVEIFRHWLWQVKRNLNNVEERRVTDWEVFPVFYSHNHGTGKSKIIERLISPLKEKTITYSLDKLKEDRSVAVDSNRKLIFFLDELQLQTQMNVETLKSWITNDRVSYRVMKTNSSDELHKNASAIGSTNKPISTFIKDTTGNRRMLEITFNVNEVPSEILNDTFENGKPKWQDNSDVWKMIWKSIDENNEVGYWNYRENKEQAEYMHNCLQGSDPSSEFLKMFDWDGQSKTQVFPTAKILSLYHYHMKKLKLGAKGITEFNSLIDSLFPSDNKKYQVFPQRVKSLKLPRILKSKYDEFGYNVLNEHNHQGVDKQLIDWINDEQVEPVYDSTREKIKTTKGELKDDDIIFENFKEEEDEIEKMLSNDEDDEIERELGL